MPVSSDFDVIPFDMEIGSRVRIIKDIDGNQKYNGMTGTIVTDMSSPGTHAYFGLVLDLTPEQITEGLGHDLLGFLPDRVGRWEAATCLEVIF